MKRVVKSACGVACAGVVLLVTFLLYIQASLPENFNLDPGERFFINQRIFITYSENESTLPLQPKVFDNLGNNFSVNINLANSNAIPVQGAVRQYVIPGGTPFGIKMICDGVIVVGMSDVQVGSEVLNPAKEAGIKVGDIITKIDGYRINGNNQVSRIFAESGGQRLHLEILRGTQTIEFYLSPIYSEAERSYKAGIWIRDSSAGIGTMTYFSPDIMGFAGLGHAICDVDTGKIMPLYSGEIVDVNISGAHAGTSGRPGELQGIFSGQAPMGTLLRNTQSGIFGTMNSPYFGGEAIPMAFKHEIQPGPAVILATISGNKPASFDIMIERVSHSDINPTKNIIIRITDQRLLSSTGGIVQGMSGSPIIQNGKLAGAVTHVFVNDPTRGYGIFAENMDKELRKVEYYRKAS